MTKDTTSGKGRRLLASASGSELSDIAEYHRTTAVRFRQERSRRERQGFGPAIPLALERKHLRWAKVIRVLIPNTKPLNRGDGDTGKERSEGTNQIAA